MIVGITARSPKRVLTLLAIFSPFPLSFRRRRTSGRRCNTGACTRYCQFSSRGRGSGLGRWSLCLPSAMSKIHDEATNKTSQDVECPSREDTDYVVVLGHDEGLPFHHELPADDAASQAPYVQPMRGDTPAATGSETGLPWGRMFPHS